MFGTRYAVSVLMFCNCAVKPLPIFPVCINLSHLFYITSSLESYPYKQCIIISGVSFLKVFLHHSFGILDPHSLYSPNDGFWEKLYSYYNVSGM